MKIIYDIYELALENGKSIGIYKYALAVLNQLATKKELEIVVICSGRNVNDISIIPNIRSIVVTDSYPKFYDRYKWRLFKAIRLSKAEKADIYFSPKGYAPFIFKRRKKPFIVLTVHDMIPFNYMEINPKFFGIFENQIVTRMLKHSVRVANKTITVSNFSKMMIQKYVGTRKNIKVIYNGVSVDPVLNPVEKEKPYIFAITSKLPHKNKIQIIKGYTAYRQLAENPLPIKICGISREDVAIPAIYSAYIECLNYVQPEELVKLYSNASLFLFLPKIEGFGFPPLEALHYGLPVVVSDIPVLREILKESACFVNPMNSFKIAEGIDKVLTNPGYKNEMLKNRQELLSKYTWSGCADQILEVFKEFSVL